MQKQTCNVQFYLISLPGLNVDQFCCEHERQLYMYIAVDVISLSLVCCYCFIRFQFVEFCLCNTSGLCEL